LLPVSEVWCHYLRSARYDDEVVIKTSVTNLTPARIEFSYSLFRSADQCLLAEGKSVHAFVTSQGKPINLRKVNESLWRVLAAGLAS
jgi:acyl-CoA thioester hydrolase